jgi:hypothetical protein
MTTAGSHYFNFFARLLENGRAVFKNAATDCAQITNLDDRILGRAAASRGRQRWAKWGCSQQMRKPTLPRPIRLI